MEKEKGTLPQILSPSSSLRRRTGNDSGSPEFEFWMVRNPAFPQPNLVSADVLFVGGIIQPLHQLEHNRETPDPPCSNPDPPPNQEPESEPGSDPGLSLSDSVVSVSRRWKDIIFKKSSDRKIKNHEDKEKEKKKEKRVSGVNSAELNINIWPFSRSRSAGNGGSRPRMAAATATARKVSSAPCSRSNSAGESKSRKWPSSPSRGGVHLGRSSPVWQVRRGGRGSEPVIRNAINGVKIEANETRRSKAAPVGGGGGAKAKVLNLNVPTCMGYRSHLSCRSDEIENSAVGMVTAGGSTGQSGRARGSDEGGRGNNNLFNLRGLFTRKVY